jgi:hypothetical protein
MKRLIFAGMLILLPQQAFADAGLFFGSMDTQRLLARLPQDQFFWGGYASFGDIIGFEGEFMHSPHSGLTRFGFRTVSFSLVAQTRHIGRIRLYGIGGGILYWFGFRPLPYVHRGGLNYGGGIKITLAEHLGIRVDGRAFTFQDEPLTPRIARIYAGFNLEF